MKFSEWLLKEEAIKVNNLSQLGNVEKIVATTTPNLYWVKTKERPEPFQVDLTNIPDNLQKQILNQFKPQQKAPEQGWITLYRGVKGKLRFLSPEEVQLKNKLNQIADQHSEKYGAVGLSKWKYWPKLTELNKIDKEQHFSDQKKDAIDYASRSSEGGQILTIQVPRQELLSRNVKFAAPVLRSVGGGGQVAIIPQDLLKELMKKYPHKLETIPPKIA